ncbi:tRNA (adenosine(37)-N6)-threonylcarbamoyltransferase complex ATPase subunit type 1 TsaE [Desulfovibrio sp.]|uniref:tRNA (adenosine(37)-N6)-threonylcarbamoyltransferase complex ATPase subunit type 1 TsaE n=1 Tax=Desulfovibrio sp. TaxID=885 RepID=UPI0025C68168|nr:tRNA (adenosine(37)-N6)-threonylcarbamoyltransferase complex ATPase subunit type 1 TsaE [Desulfovibrio sp.]
MAQITLATLDDTRCFADLLVRALGNAPEVKTLLLRGDLGSGKTTLTRFMVLGLPGGTEAEVASPSFTLCNHYPTVPPVLHCDLYRCPGSLPEDLLEALDNLRTLIIIEWAEFLPDQERPEEYLDIALKACEEGHLLTLQACGLKAEALLRHLCEQWTVSRV